MLYINNLTIVFCKRLPLHVPKWKASTVFLGVANDFTLELIYL